MPKRRKTEPEADRVKFGPQIKAARQKLGITQSELADRLDISHQQISKYERDADDIAASRLRHVAEILNTPVEALYPPPERSLGEAPQTEYIVSTLDNVAALLAELRSILDTLDKVVRSARG